MLAAWEWGEGPTVVLVHGWGSRAGRFSVMGAALLEAGFRVVAYRRSGAWRVHADASPRCPSSRGRSAPSATKSARSHGMVGHSLGGAAVALALGDGLAADRVVLIASPADVVRFSTAFADHLGLTPVTRHAMRRNLEDRLRIRWDELHLPTIARSLRIAALVVHDRGDTDIPYGQSLEIARAWPGARHVATDGLGHRALLRDAGVVRQVVEFLGEGDSR